MRETPSTGTRGAPRRSTAPLAEDRPILLSVGYSACHWCHVMEHESFENAAIARSMNDNFVCIKVDREERPDLDAGLHGRGRQPMTGSGGWPMTVFLTPDGQPFFGGTYFPPEPRHGLPAFRQVLQAIAEAWRDRRADVVRSGGDLASPSARGSACCRRRSSRRRSRS